MNIEDDYIFDYEYIENFDDYYEYEEEFDDLSLLELWNSCLKPILFGGLSPIPEIFVCCLIFKIISSISLKKYPNVCYFSSCILSLVALYYPFGLYSIYVVCLAILGYFTYRSSRWFSPLYSGLIMAGFVTTYIVACELCIDDPQKWHKIKGPHMVLSMSLISMAFSSSSNLISSVPCFMGSTLFVGNIVFGPWIPTHILKDLLSNRFKDPKWYWEMVRYAAYAAFFLTLSTCWVTWLIPDDSWVLLVTYRDALSFRSSHYFVAYLSQLLCCTCGLSFEQLGEMRHVVNPSKIELPRSLVEVVVSWNIPMHFWLKTYIFFPTKPLIGSFGAVVLTYLASSLLHGLYFQVAAVLISLSLYTYVEHELRKKLASIYDACILARACKKECQHANKGGVYVRLTNLGFGVLAMLHLAYLGVVFDTSPSSMAEQGYSMEHTLTKWGDLGYFSHWIALATFIVYKLL